MKAKIDARLCKHCDFGDKDNQIDGKSLCVSKVQGGYCKFDK